MRNCGPQSNQDINTSVDVGGISHDIAMQFPQGQAKSRQSSAAHRLISFISVAPMLL